jgi:SAM-dependent methyltransferase
MGPFKDLLTHLAAPRRPHPAARPATGDVGAAFRARAAALAHPRVLELGTLRSLPGRSTLHRDWVPHHGEFLGSDIAPGPDVDIVADVHRLSTVAGQEQFDVILSFSTFEHLKYPHLAALELLKVLRPGGLLFVQTHQTFPVHGYPHDYYRYTREGLAALFGTRMGFTVRATDYEFPTSIHTRRVPQLAHHEAWLNTRLVGEKTGPTPTDYVVELDYGAAP